MIRAMMRKYEDSVHEYRLACRKKYEADFVYYGDEDFFSGLSPQDLIDVVEFHEEFYGNELLNKGYYLLRDLDYIIYSLHLDVSDKIFLLEKKIEEVNRHFRPDTEARRGFLDWIERALDDLKKLQKNQFTLSPLHIIEAMIRGEIDDRGALKEAALLETQIAHRIFEDDPDCDYREIIDKWADIEANVNHLKEDEKNKEWNLLVQDLEARISPYGLHAHDIYKLHDYKEAWAFQCTIEEKPAEPPTTAAAPTPTQVKEEPEPMAYFAQYIGQYLSKLPGGSYKVEGDLAAYLRDAYEQYPELCSKMLYNKLYDSTNEKIKDSVIRTTLSAARKSTRQTKQET